VTDYVLDSFALIAYAEGEPTESRVNEVIGEAQAGASSIAMTTVNIGEVLYTSQRRHGVQGVVHALNLISEIPLEVVDVDMNLAILAARIKAVTPIAYGDCFGAALALQRSAVFLTGDPEFARLQGLITVEWLPQPGRS
jgi:predicted nucleic acid-binding protein